MNNMIAVKQAYYRQASHLIWRLLNARLIRQTASPLPKGNKQIRLACEIPVDHPKYGKVLLMMDGMTFRPYSKGRVPIVTSNSVRGVVGSVRGITVVDRQLLGTVVFAGDSGAQAVASRWLHLDTSNLVLDFIIDRSVKITKGKTFRGYDGPFLVAESWTPIAARFQV